MSYVADEPIAEEKTVEVASPIAAVATPIATLLDHVKYLRECIANREANIVVHEECIACMSA